MRSRHLAADGIVAPPGRCRMARHDGEPLFRWVEHEQFAYYVTSPT